MSFICPCGKRKKEELLMNFSVKKIFKPYKKLVYSLSRRRKKTFDPGVKVHDIKKTFSDRRKEYYHFHQYFWNEAPEWLRVHRAYFSGDERGFGEDAFHAMWYLIFKELRPKTVLEIGVYRGQIVSLWALLAEKFNIDAEIHGISPFTAEGDEVSEYIRNIDYYEDAIKNCRKFVLKTPVFHKGFSTDKKMQDIISSREWDIIYVDGSHDYEVAREDFNICSRSLSQGGLLVMDDSALYTGYKPFTYSSAGHPGPSRVVEEEAAEIFEEIISCGHNRCFRKLSIILNK